MGKSITNNYSTVQEGDDTMSATAQNYVYRVKITDEKAMQDKPSISREELERIKREVAQYLVRPGERKN